MFAAFRLGAVWVPTNFRLMPDEVAYLATASGAKAFLCHGDFPDHAKAAANPALEFIWRIGEGGVWREVRGRGDRGACGRQGRERGGRLRRSLLVLLHLGHHRPFQGGGADPRPDGLCGDQSSRRSDARHDGDGCLAGGRAAVAWRRRAPARAGRARRADHPAALGEIRHRRSVPADRGAPRQQHFYRADHFEDDGRASRGRQIRSFLAALHDLCRRADVPRGPEGGAEQARPGAGAVFRPRRGHRQHHGDAGQSARSRGRPAGPDRHLRLRAHGHAGLDPGR